MLKLMLFVLLCALGVWLVRSVSSGLRGGGSDRAQRVDPAARRRSVEAEFTVLGDDEGESDDDRADAG